MENHATPTGAVLQQPIVVGVVGFISPADGTDISQVTSQTPFNHTYTTFLVKPCNNVIETAEALHQKGNAQVQANIGADAIRASHRECASFEDSVSVPEQMENTQIQEVNASVRSLESDIQRNATEVLVRNPKMPFKRWSELFPTLSRAAYTRYRKRLGCTRSYIRRGSHVATFKSNILRNANEVLIQNPKMPFKKWAKLFPELSRGTYSRYRKRLGRDTIRAAHKETITKKECTSLEDSVLEQMLNTQVQTLGHCDTISGWPEETIIIKKECAPCEDSVTGQMLNTQVQTLGHCDTISGWPEETIIIKKECALCEDSVTGQMLNTQVQTLGHCDTISGWPEETIIIKKECALDKL